MQYERGRRGGEGIRVRDHLANVRTLLAFLRVGVVLLGLGAVIDKLAVIEHSSAVVGLPIAIGGCLVTVLAAARFLLQRRAIEGHDLRSHAIWDIVVVSLAAAVGLAILFYLKLGSA